MSTRIMIALIFAVVLSFSFRRSWRQEEDRKYMLKSDNGTGETYVYMSPFVVLSVLLVYIIIFTLTQGCQKVFYLLADVIANIFPYYILLSVGIFVLRKYISARACAILWLFPVFLFYQPHILMEDAFVPRITFYIPENILTILFYIWISGAVVVLLWKFLGHIHFRKQILENADKIADKTVLDIWKQEYEKSNYKQKVELYYSKQVKTPLSMGLFAHTRVVVLPYKIYSEEELSFIFQHEITHLQRLDIDTKVALTIYHAVGWFNPLMWIAVRKANEDLELSCDELVLKECDERQRKRYANLLLKTVGDSKGFTTCLSVDARALRYRLKNVINRRKVFRGTIIIGIIFFFFYMSYGLVAFTTGRTTVKDVIFSNERNMKIDSMYYRNHDTDEYIHSSKLDISNDELERMNEYIFQIEVEKYVGINQPDAEGYTIIYERYNDNDALEQISLCDSLLTVECWEKPTEYYIIKSDVDWNYIMSCIET